jgi:hypothetical protein
MIAASACICYQGWFGMLILPDRPLPLGKAPRAECERFPLSDEGGDVCWWRLRQKYEAAAVEISARAAAGGCVLEHTTTERRCVLLTTTLEVRGGGGGNFCACGCRGMCVRAYYHWAPMCVDRSILPLNNHGLCVLMTTSEVWGGGDAELCASGHGGDVCLSILPLSTIVCWCTQYRIVYDNIVLYIIRIVYVQYRIVSYTHNIV